jgi:hypothetical protein
VRIAQIKKNPKWNPSKPNLSFAANPSQNAMGNLCVSGANDGGRFRFEYCCKACKNLRTYMQRLLLFSICCIFSVGGGNQAIKDDQFMGTTRGEKCEDNTTLATVYCNVCLELFHPVYFVKIIRLLPPNRTNKNYLRATRLQLDYIVQQRVTSVQQQHWQYYTRL